jgi:predicted outer membrane repeat protein
MTLRFAVVLALVFTVSSVASARTWLVRPDGMGDAPTIQAGIDSASAGDTVLVACGTYYEADITIDKSGIVLVSETGESDCSIIDANWSGRIFDCHSFDSTTVIRGFTLTHGIPSAEGTGYGGGMLCESASPRILDCDFVHNLTNELGGAIYIARGGVLLLRCRFLGNQGGSGAAFCAGWSDLVVEECIFDENTGRQATICGASTTIEIKNCTFVRNSAETGGAAFYCSDSSLRMDRTIIAYSAAGVPIDCGEFWPCTVSLTCCDIYANADGDWVGCIADQLGQNGNFSACPSFCDLSAADYMLCDESPCLPGNHPSGYECGLIGALGVGCICGPSHTEPSTWGAIKAMYR